MLPTFHSLHLGCYEVSNLDPLCSPTMVFCLTPVQNQTNLIDSVPKALKPSVKANGHSCKLFLLGNLSLWQIRDWYTFWPVEYEIRGAIWLASKRDKSHVKKCTISKVLPFEATVSAGAINNTVHRWTCTCRGIYTNPPK